MLGQSYRGSVRGQYRLAGTGEAVCRWNKAVDNGTSTGVYVIMTKIRAGVLIAGTWHLLCAMSKLFTDKSFTARR